MCHISCHCVISGSVHLRALFDLVSVIGVIGCFVSEFGVAGGSPVASSEEDGPAEEVCAVVACICAEE